MINPYTNIQALQYFGLWVTTDKKTRDQGLWSPQKSEASQIISCFWNYMTILKILLKILKA